MAAIFDSFPYDTRSMDEQDWKLMFSWVRSDGILSANSPLSNVGDSAVAPSSGMTLQIYPGLAWIQGFYFSYTEDPLNPGNYQFSIGSNTSGNPRIDLVVLRLDLTLNNMAYAVIQGTPAASPIPPLLTQNNLTWEMPIAQIYVADGATVINIGDITDLRVTSTQTTISPSLDLDDLTDVTITGPTTNQFLGYDVPSAKWINKLVDASGTPLSGLSDVTITTPVAGNFLAYDSGTSSWVNSNLPAFDESLDDLNNVTITAPVAGNYLRYDTGSSTWTNQSMLLAELYSDSNATATTFTNTTSYVPMVTSAPGTLMSMPMGLFSQSSNGVLTYLGSDTLCFHSGATLSLDGSFNGADINICMLLNGAYVPGSLVRVTLATSGQDQSTAIHKILTLNTNDTITLGVNFANWAVGRTVTFLAYNICMVTM